MKYKKGDRILYNRQKFGTVHHDQFDQSEVAVVFDREKSKVVLVRLDTLELVSDPQHEARLAMLINSPVKSNITDGQHTAVVGVRGLAEELTKIADDLATGADQETNVLRLRTTMLHISHRLHDIAKEL